MGRYGRRISRSLIGVLIVTLVLGLVFFLKNLGKTEAEPTPAVTVTPAAAPIVAAKPAPATAPAPMITETPTESVIVQQIALAPPTSAPAAKVESSPTAIADAKAKQDAGDLIAARKILNNALLSGTLSEADAESVKKTISQLNQTLIFSPQKFAGDEYATSYTVQSGDLLTKIALPHEIPWEAILRFNGMTDAKKLRAGQTLKIVQGPFNAIVTKSKFTIDLYLGPPGEKGSMFITQLPVGLGREDSTPTGTWICEAGKKLKRPTYYNPRATGDRIIAQDDPKNPLGTRWIGLTGINGRAVGQESYGIHGTIEDDSIGKQASMGCIRMHNADVELVFDLLADGKSIVVVKD
ncbi:MAG TPA: L,D-transpeptidase family protein [Tepidisphaeraceae bacterium]|nr:L,D-transpeptidase family protein [Tepidisphaeraceae bacterium]